MFKEKRDEVATFKKKSTIILTTGSSLKVDEDTLARVSQICERR